MAAFDYGPRFVLDRFAELVPSLPVHAPATRRGCCSSCTTCGSTRRRGWPRSASSSARSARRSPTCSARRLRPSAVARVAGVLAAFSPRAALRRHSADAVFLTLGLLAAIPLLSERPWLGAVALAVGSLFAWSLLAVGAWAAILVLARDGLKPRSGSPAHRRHADRVPRPVRARHRLRPDRHDPGDGGRVPGRDRVAPPLRVLAVRLPHRVPADPRRADHLARAASAAAPRRRDLRRARDRRVLGFTKAETERIWLFLVPFVCLAAAPVVRRPS